MAAEAAMAVESTAAVADPHQEATEAGRVRSFR